MPDSTSAQPILDAAEQAAVVGDIHAAEQLLRQAVRLQETHLGPHHPDLANTLNNLASSARRRDGWTRRRAAIDGRTISPPPRSTLTIRS